jgi:2-amino-4-hydroxy-6-hydroxymethyldihydropteridine diphosphokinase
MRAYIGLGSNLGDREQYLRKAIELLGAEPEIDVLAVSSVRETKPVDFVDQPRFLNAAAKAETSLSAKALLQRLLAIEQALGRSRAGRRFGPRIIDLDLLLYGDQIVDAPGLTVPHPRLAERRFALEPLHELDPDLVVPGRGPVLDLLAALQ